MKTPSYRSKNAVGADSETVTSGDGERRVTFRHAKRSLGGGRYDIVRVAYCKRRIDGRWRVVLSGVSEHAGQMFLSGQ